MSWVGFRRSVFCLATVVIGCASADGTKTGNGVTMEFGAKGQPLQISDGADAGGLSLEGLRTVDASGAAFYITDAKLAVSDVRLRKVNGVVCAGPRSSKIECDANRFGFAGDFEVDLLSRTAQPSLLDYEVPPGQYERIDVKIARLKRDSALGDSTFRAVGSFEYLDQRYPFSLSLKRTENLRFEAAGAVQVESGQALLAGFDVASWFTQLPIVECLENGRLQWDGESLEILEKGEGCSELDKAFADALRASTELSAIEPSSME